MIAIQECVSVADSVKIIDTNFDAEVLKNDRVIIAGFWAEWNEPSKKMLDTLKKVADDFTGDVKLVTVDIDKAPATVSTYRVLNVPTMAAYKNGVVVATIEGKASASEIKKTLKPFLPPE